MFVLTGISYRPKFINNIKFLASTAFFLRVVKGLKNNEQTQRGHFLSNNNAVMFFFSLLTDELHKKGS